LIDIDTADEDAAAAATAAAIMDDDDDKNTVVRNRPRPKLNSSIMEGLVAACRGVCPVTTGSSSGRLEVSHRESYGSIESSYDSAP
jgi:hypothetical protein